MEPYGGAYQFSVTTWQYLGFSGMPNEASSATQDAAAFKLYRIAGLWSSESWLSDYAKCG